MKHAAPSSPAASLAGLSEDGPVLFFDAMRLWQTLYLGALSSWFVMWGL